MELLILHASGEYSEVNAEFKFQYGATNISFFVILPYNSKTFKFQYGATNIYPYNTLLISNSKFKFQYGATNIFR